MGSRPSSYRVVIPAERSESGTSLAAAVPATGSPALALTLGGNDDRNGRHAVIPASGA